jgi:hypothetical protein
MRSIVIAMLSISCTCVREEPRRVPEPRTPIAMSPPIDIRAVRGDNREPASTLAVATPAVATVAVAEPPAPPGDPRATTRQAAHDVLAEHCGECHEGHRPTAKPPALAVFDLDKPDWPERFDEHKFQSALKRLAGKSPAARDAFIAFRDAELAAAPAKVP